MIICIHLPIFAHICPIKVTHILRILRQYHPGYVFEDRKRIKLWLWVIDVIDVIEPKPSHLWCKSGS